MLRRVCDICGRVITDDIVKVEDPKIFMNKLNPYNIGITCPKDCDWDLCPSCREKLYSWVQEQKAAVKESFDAEDKEWGTMEERCHEEAIIESAPHALQRIRDRILEAKRNLRGM